MRDKNDTHKILILGGGYAGVMAASRLVINGIRAEITLVDARPELVQRIRMHETLAGSTPKTLPYRLLERRASASSRPGWRRWSPGSGGSSPAPRRASGWRWSTTP